METGKHVSHFSFVSCHRVCLAFLAPYCGHEKFMICLSWESRPPPDTMTALLKKRHKGGKGGLLEIQKSRTGHSSY